MLINWTFLITLFLGSIQVGHTQGEDMLEKFCQEYSGEVKFGFTCPKSKIPLPLRMCHFSNSHKEKQFFDGCSGPSGGYKELFFPACIKHDLCYHHEPASNGKDRKFCDDLFLEIMNNACETVENKKNCLKWAKTMYKGVRAIGTPAFHCENIKGHY